MFQEYSVVIITLVLVGLTLIFDFGLVFDLNNAPVHFQASGPVGSIRGVGPIHNFPPTSGALARKTPIF